MHKGGGGKEDGAERVTERRANLPPGLSEGLTLCVALLSSSAPLCSPLPLFSCYCPKTGSQAVLCKPLLSPLRLKAPVQKPLRIVSFISSLTFSLFIHNKMLIRGQGLACFPLSRVQIKIFYCCKLYMNTCFDRFKMTCSKKGDSGLEVSLYNWV